MNSQYPSVSALEAHQHPRHRWYFFKEAFSPDIVHHAIKDAELRPGSVVVDPFSGSGTTPITASSAGFSSYGIEVNPFLKFVADAKSSQSTGKDFKKNLKAALSKINIEKPMWLEEFSTFSEKSDAALKRDKWLFNSEVLRAYSSALGATKKFSQDDAALVKLCLIGAAMDSANAVKDGKCLRYRKDWSSLALGKDDFCEAALSRAEDMIDDLDSNQPMTTRPLVVNGDSRKTTFPKQFDLCVTSPPYLNSFDYTDVYRPELFLGGFVNSMAELRALRMATLRSHVQASWHSPVEKDFGPHYADAIRELKDRMLFLWSDRLPEMVQAYFEDILGVLTRLRARAKKNASVSLIVSTSAYAGVEIPVDLIIADIASRNGWFLREVVVLRYLKRVSCQQWYELSARNKNNMPHLRESMVILDARPHK